MTERRYRSVGKKLRVLTICKYEGPAQQFLDLVKLFPHWDASAVLLFSNPEFQAHLERAGIRCSRFPVPRFLFENPYLNLAARVVLDGYHFVASSWLYRRYAADADVIFNMDSNPFGPGKWIVRWARRAGILTLRWTFGNIAPGHDYRLHWFTERYLRALGFEVEGYWGVRCHTDYTLVGSPESRDLLAQSGVPHEKMFVVGNYLHDKLDHLGRTSGPGRGILILSQPFGPEGRTTIRQLAEGLEGIPGWPVTIKLHPRDEPDLYRDWANEHPEVALIPHGEDTTEDLIARARLVIGFTSTSVATALYLNKKVIFVRYSNRTTTANFYARYVRRFSLLGIDDIPRIRRDISEDRLENYEQEIAPGALATLCGQPGFTHRVNEVIDSLLTGVRGDGRSQMEMAATG